MARVQREQKQKEKERIEREKREQEIRELQEMEMKRKQKEKESIKISDDETIKNISMFNREWEDKKNEILQGLGLGMDINTRRGKLFF